MDTKENQDKYSTAYRIEQCKNCPSLTAIKTCKECGCVMPVKVRFKWAGCPLNKWDPVPGSKHPMDILK